MPCHEKPDPWRLFHEAGWDQLWYANPGGDYRRSKTTPCWFAGTWTGPQRDLLCVKDCETNEEAERWLSPAGWTPEEAVELAIHKRDHSNEP